MSKQAPTVSNKGTHNFETHRGPESPLRSSTICRKIIASQNTSFLSLKLCVWLHRVLMPTTLSSCAPAFLCNGFVLQTAEKDRKLNATGITTTGTSHAICYLVAFPPILVLVHCHWPHETRCSRIICTYPHPLYTKLFPITSKTAPAKINNSRLFGSCNCIQNPRKAGQAELHKKHSPKPIASAYPKLGTFWRPP